MEYNIELLIEKAKAEPTKPERFRKVMPIVQILREDKEYTWEEIRNWMQQETPHNVTAALWRSRYDTWKKEEGLKRTGTTDISQH